jgi:hypothetical protein
VERRALSQLCFILVAMIGVGCILVGPALDVSRPDFQLDVVLTPEELRDDALRERTLAELKRNNHRRDWPYWAVAGAILTAVGSIGLFASVDRRGQRSKAAQV